MNVTFTWLLIITIGFAPVEPSLAQTMNLGGQTLQLNGTAHVAAGGRLGLSSGRNNRGSAYTVGATTLGSLGSFTTTFNASLIHSPDAQKPQADGLAFVVQADPAGAYTLGGLGGCLGVCDITNYAAIAFASWVNNTAGLWTADGKTVSAMSLGAQTDPLHVIVTYDGVQKTIFFRAHNSATGQTVSNTYPLDLSTMGTSYHFGFSGATGHGRARELIDSWTLTVTPRG